MKVYFGWKSVLFCALGGLCFTGSALAGGGHFAWSWVAGILIAAALLPVVMFGPKNKWAQFGSIALVLIVVGLVCTMSEAVLFYPEMRKMLVPTLAGGSVFYAIDAAVLVLLGRVLKLSASTPDVVQHRPVAVAVPMVLLSGLSYVLYYLVFGFIAFQFFTKQYYPHAAEQAGALGMWFWAYQWGRGLLMTLAVLPVIYALRIPRWKAAILIGLMVWIVGGGASLLVPSTLMVPAQRYAHIIEIMTQNVSLGMTAMWLLSTKTSKLAEPKQEPVAV